VLFIGDDWAEAHHDIEIEDEAGRVLARRRLPEGLVAQHLDPTAEPDQVQVGIETDRGPWVQALLAAGYGVFAINPLQVARYRERHSPSGAKSDAADAHLLAEIVRLDRAHHRRIAGDSEIAEHVKIAARAHQTMIWSRVRQVNTLRSLLREYYPAALAAFGTDLRRPRRTGGAHRGTEPRLGSAAVPIAYRNPAAACWPAAEHLQHRRHDPGRVDLRAAGRPTRCDRCLHRQRISAASCVEHHGGPDRGTGWAGGAGFWPAPGR
jgi:transposase